MKIEEAVKMMSNGEELFDYYDNFEELSLEVEKGFSSIQDWQLRGKLGEVGFNYYSETGKTVTLSVGFMDYFTTLNDIDMNLVEYDDDEDVEFGVVFVVYENEGDTYNESYYVNLKEKNFEEVTERYKEEVVSFFKQND